MEKVFRGLILVVSTLSLVGAFVGSAMAIPALQLYIEGATYDDNTETWVLSGEDDFKLWVIGDVGSYGTISDVKLAGAVATSELGGGSSIRL